KRAPRASRKRRGSISKPVTPMRITEDDTVMPASEHSAAPAVSTATRAYTQEKARQSLGADGPRRKARINAATSGRNSASDRSIEVPGIIPAPREAPMREGP